MRNKKGWSGLDIPSLSGVYRTNTVCPDRGERPALRPTGAACAKKGRIVGGVGCSPSCRTSGKLRGSSDSLGLFRKMLHFGKIPKIFGQIWRIFSKNQFKIWQNLRNFGKKQQQFQQFLTKILRLASGAKECIV